MGTNDSSNQSTSKDRRDPRIELTYTTVSKAPASCEFRYTEAEICSHCLKIVRDQIPDFTEFTIDADPRTGEISAFAWIDADNKHMTDKSMENNPNMVFHISIPRVSDEINRFTERFCKKNEKKPYRDQTNSKRLGFKVDLTKFIDIIVDKRGEAFQKEFGYRPGQFDVEIVAVFRERKDVGKYGSLDYISIVKSFHNRQVASKKPIPVRAYNKR